jgi:hypothetical protein
MFRKLVILILAGVLIMSACTQLIEPAGPGPTPVESNAPVQSEQPNPDQPVSGEPGAETPGEPSWQPAPGDDALKRGEATIDSTEILILESFPPQFVLNVKGSQGDPCRQVRAVIGEPDAENHIQVEIYTVYDPAAVCILMLKEFELNLPLGSFEQGTYTVFINGQEVGTLTAP